LLLPSLVCRHDLSVRVLLPHGLVGLGLNALNERAAAGSGFLPLLKLLRGHRRSQCCRRRQRYARNTNHLSAPSSGLLDATATGFVALAASLVGLLPDASRLRLVASLLGRRLVHLLLVLRLMIFVVVVSFLHDLAYAKSCERA
jgi:hypothetical protein